MNWERLSIAISSFPQFILREYFWYVLWCSLFWLAFYVFFRRRMAPRKIVSRYPSTQQVSWEILYSARSLLIFALVGTCMVYAVASGWTPMYFQVEKYGWPWLVASAVLAISMHDLYFYATHRLMHHPKLYRVMHRTHHLSTNPSPWAAYSFSIWEALVQAAIGPIVIFTVPLHPFALLAFVLWRHSFSVLGHCGFEVFPAWLMRSGLGKLINTPTHHALHHEKFLANYSLYFNVWDRLLGTNHPEYESRFEQVTGNPSQSANSVG